MPIGFSPDDYTEQSLDVIDKGKPEAERAKFRLRFLTSGEEMKVSRLRDAAINTLDKEEQNRLLGLAIRIGVIGWTGLKNSAGRPIPFAPAPPPPPPPTPVGGAVAAPTPAPAAEPPEPPYDVLDEFTTRQKFQMIDQYLRALLYTPAESFRSSSPSAAATASSADGAAAGGASTPPAAANP